MSLGSKSFVVCFFFVCFVVVCVINAVGVFSCLVCQDVVQWCVGLDCR